jgi:hypothetical protein
MLCYLVALQIVREAAGVWDRLAMSAVATGHPELAEVADTRDVRHGSSTRKFLSRMSMLPSIPFHKYFQKFQNKFSNT